MQEIKTSDQSNRVEAEDNSSTAPRKFVWQTPQLVVTTLVELTNFGGNSASDGDGVS